MMVAGDGALFVVTGRTLSALDAEHGRTIWEAALEAPFTAPPVVMSGWLIAIEEGTIRAVRTADGSVVWTESLGGTTVHPVSLDGLRAYVALDDNRIVALRIQNGSRVWERRLGGPPQPVLARGDRVFVGAADNYFYCLRATDGEVLWRWRTGADPVGLAAHDDERVYVTAMDNLLRGLDAGSGAQRWRAPLPIRPTSGPVRADQTLLVFGLAGTVLGFHTKDGKTAGDFDAGGPLAVPPHVITTAAWPAPFVVTVTRSIANGTTLTAVTRDFEPPARPLAPLPNPAPVEQLPGAPATPDTPETAPAGLSPGAPSGGPAADAAAAQVDTGPPR
jgi:outer membrane protein assembly factor BamB